MGSVAERPIRGKDAPEKDRRFDPLDCPVSQPRVAGLSSVAGSSLGMQAKAALSNCGTNGLNGLVIGKSFNSKHLAPSGRTLLRLFLLILIVAGVAGLADGVDPLTGGGLLALLGQAGQLDALGRKLIGELLVIRVITLVVI